MSPRKSSSPPTEAAAAPAPPSKLQMADIARLANVSISTVSRALANNPRLSEETRNRVNELARSLNYSINVGARILRGKPLQTVAVAFPYHPAQRQHFKDPFFLALLGAIGDALIDSGHSMLVVGVEEDKRAHLLETHETGQAIGTIMLGQENNHDLFNELAVRGLPFVVWGARLPNQLYCTVGSDNVMGGQQAASHLLQCGARRIAFFGDRRLAEVGQRYDGYLQAHTELGLAPSPELYCPVPFADADVQTEMARLLREGIAFDAVQACSDVMALTVIATLRAAGKRVPEDVLVTGFDDIRLAAQGTPPLTTIHQSIEEAGRELVALLLEKVAGKTVHPVVLPTQLVVRSSTALMEWTHPS